MGCCPVPPLPWGLLPVTLFSHPCGRLWLRGATICVAPGTSVASLGTLGTSLSMPQEDPEEQGQKHLALGSVGPALRNI